MTYRLRTTARRSADRHPVALALNAPLDLLMLRQFGTLGAKEVALGMEVALLLVLGVRASHCGLRPQRGLPGHALDPPAW